MVVVGPLFVTCSVCSIFCLVTGGSKITDSEEKTCALAQECGESSLNFGTAKTVVTSKCCNSDLCKTQSATGNLHPACIILHCAGLF